MKLKHRLDDRNLKVTYCYVTATKMEEYVGLLPCLYEFTEKRKRIKILAANSFTDTKGIVMDILPGRVTPARKGKEFSNGLDSELLAALK